MRILVIHPGTQYSHALVQQLAARGFQVHFVTGFVIIGNSLVGKLCSWLPSYLKVKIKNRIINESHLLTITSNVVPELVAMLSSFVIKNEDYYYLRNKIFQYLIKDKFIFEADFVISFDTSSWIIQDKCKKYKKNLILDVSIGHPIYKEEVYSALLRMYPKWKHQLHPKNEKYLNNEILEIEGADIIVVPSSFVRKSYIDKGVDIEKIKLIPFGTDLSFFQQSNLRIERTSFNFLFFGSMSVRKGLPLLLEAWSLIDAQACNLIIAGYGNLPADMTLPKGVVNIGPVSAEGRLNLYQNADVFVFPSNFEGFAQVQIEAAACGLPIIGTFNSGATELVINGENGFVIEENNVDQLCAAMSYFINNPREAAIMGCKALKAAKNFTWDNYGANWSDLIKSMSELREH